MSASTTAENELVITRVFDAPRELVWRVWTESAHITEWWGPRGFNTTVTANDLRPGGKWRFVMHGPDGAEYPVNGVFREVVPMERIVTTDEFDPDWQPPVPMDLPKGIVVTALFADEGNKTRLTLRISHATPEDRKKHEAMGVVGGWQSSFDCMDDYLASLTDEAKLRQLIADQYSAIGAKNLSEMMKPYAPGLVVFDVKPPYSMTGPAALQKMWEACLPYFPDSCRLETRDLSITTGGTAAFAHWLFRIVTPDPAHPAGQTWMRATACYQKVNGVWQVVHEHCSVPFDPMTGKAVFALEV